MTSSTQVTPKRSVSIPNAGPHCAGPNGSTTVAPSASASQRAPTSSTVSPRTDRKQLALSAAVRAPEPGEWRTYRVDRMTPRAPNGPRFTPREVPGGDVGAFLAARFKGADPGATAAAPADPWPCTGEVVLDLPLARVAPFAGDGLAEELGPGRTRLRTGAWSWVALAAGLARFDADIEVVGPPELRDAFAGLAARAARAAGDVTDVTASGGHPAAGGSRPAAPSPPGARR